MSNKRKFLSLAFMILSAFWPWFFSCKEKQKDPEEALRERYEKLGIEKDRLLREQREQQNIGPRQKCQRACFS
jgi:hypothetical protein